ncbi:MAG: D-alanyl-D-alanine carboxypeptidase [Candidatus Sungbacteria bacterium]|nr:D-alanyl-D-alanine carboxypeptidase [Candidatus Sungbacteria bacterium]
MDHEEEIIQRKERFVGLAALLLVGVALLTSAAKKELAAVAPFIFPDPALSSAKQSTALSAPLPPAPELLAHAFLVRFAGEYQPLLRQREWKSLPPASITKLLTALIAFERLEKDDVLVISKEAKAVGEKQSGVLAGEQFRRDDVLRFALISSANDAAYALAEAVGRKEGALSWEQAIVRFADMMQRRGRGLGMASSFFRNPAGLDEQGNRTTALDIALLAEYIKKNAPDLFSFSREREARIASFEGREYMAVNTNPLLEEFPALQGTKTGFTDEAQGTLLMLYPVAPDKTAIVVILGSRDRFADGRKIIRWLEELQLK